MFNVRIFQGYSDVYVRKSMNKYEEITYIRVEENVDVLEDVRRECCDVSLMN